MKGYQDCVIRVDLPTGRIAKEELKPDYVQRYLGGEGYGIALLWDEVTPETKALDPANVLSFNTGPLTATPVPSSSRTSVEFISPLTNSIGASTMGSHWGAELK